jgi:acyl carrier protein
MSRQDFLHSLDEILEQPPGTLQGSEALEDYPFWDSTAMISFMALADSNNGIKLAPKQLAACVTVADLLRLAGVEPSADQVGS